MGEWQCAYVSHSAYCIFPAGGLEPQPFLRLHLFLCWHSKMTGGGHQRAAQYGEIASLDCGSPHQRKKHTVWHSSFDGSEHGVNIHAATAPLRAKTKRSAQELA